jgi:hypothetical protein
MGLQTNVAVDFKANIDGNQGIFGVVQELAKRFALTLPNGTTAGKANRLYAAELSIGTGATQDLDLAGALLDVLGAAVSFVNVRAIVLKADDTNTTNVTVGADAAPFVGPFGAGTHTVVLKPGMMVVFADKNGWGVTATTADILQFVNAAGATAKVQVLIVGTDA